MGLLGLCVVAEQLGSCLHHHRELIAASVAALYAECMKTLQYVHWQHETMWLGYLVEFPDYWTQGETREDLEENLKDLYQELASGRIPEVRQVAELRIA